MGPWKQIKNMFKGHRLAATVVYLCSIGFTLYAALKLNNLALTLIFLLVQVGPHARAHMLREELLTWNPTSYSSSIQICALVWYCMTYVPFGQRMLKSCVGRCIGDFGDDW